MLVPIVLVSGYLAVGRAKPGAALSLVDAYPTTIKRSSLPDVETFSVYDHTLNGETKRVVYARPPSRITWKVTPPAKAQLRAWLALRGEAWILPGDGVVFRIGVSDGKVYREVVNQRVNPFGNPDDRKWIPVTVDLSAYAGKPIEVIFNNDRSLPTDPSDGRNDLALWGDPTIVSPHD
jgi:hypothetical protein